MINGPTRKVRQIVAVVLGAALSAMCPLSFVSGQVSLVQPTPSPSQARLADTTANDSTATVAAPGSPRAAMTAFLTSARAGDFAGAARYLERPAAPFDSAAAARRLKLVLDRYAWIDLASLSAAAEGDTTDGLPPGVDEAARVKIAGVEQSMRLRRTVLLGPDAPDTLWRFSRRTVDQIPGWYATLGNRWLVDRLPAALLRAGPFDLLWWQWLAAIPAVLVVLLLGSVVGRALRWALAQASHRTSNTWDDLALQRLGAPISAFCTVTVLFVAIPLLGLSGPATAGAFRLVRIGYSVTTFWAVWRLIDVARRSLGQTHWARNLPASRSLLPLASRLAKVAVAALGLVAVLSTLGYPVTTLVAGLGIGGLALALAAQKTVENLFGAFSIGIDQPFREGDFVKVDDFVGTVEAIGLRSSRFRTLDRTIVSLPNGRLADMRLESFSVRDRLRLATVIGLVYETNAAQMRAVLAGFERVLRAHPKIWPDAIVVRFAELAASSLNIEVMAWFTTSDWSEFQLIRQEVLLSFMDVVESAGTSFAFPTTTVHLASGAPTIAAAEERADG